VARSIDCGHFPLTQKRALFKFKTVFIPRMKHPHDLWRIVGVGMLLFVFFLPLHFHPIAASVQVAKECSCLRGTRTDAGLAVAPALWFPILPAQPVASESLDCLTHFRFQNHGIRAPPSHALSNS
jgi:hypothetical protein